MQSTLWTLRRRIERLTAPAGPFRVVDAETGRSPVPVDGCRFDTRRRARTAVGLARAYRHALREYDPRTPRYTLVVERDAAVRAVATPRREREGSL
jgi:hypothetical protein